MLAQAKAFHITKLEVGTASKCAVSVSAMALRGWPSAGCLR
jgi:hypothetical protein